MLAGRGIQRHMALLGLSEASLLVCLGFVVDMLAILLGVTLLNTEVYYFFFLKQTTIANFCGSK